jgi:hypothetical protein
MNRTFRLAVLLGILGLFPTLAVGQAAKVDVAKIRAKLIAGSTTIEGKLARIDAAANQFTFHHLYRVPNPQQQAKLLAIQQQFNTMLGIRSTSLDALRKVQKEGRDALKAAYDETPIPIEVKGDDKLIVRTMLTPTDADGKPKKLSAAELQKLRGKDLRLPGFVATVKDLDSTQWVRISLNKAVKPSGDPPVHSISMIVIIPAPKEFDLFQIPGE